jgi:hypothetical protein
MHRLGLVDICAHYFELIGFSLMPFRPTCVVSFKFLVSILNFPHNKQHDVEGNIGFDYQCAKNTLMSTFNMVKEPSTKEFMLSMLSNQEKPLGQLMHH